MEWLKMMENSTLSERSGLWFCRYDTSATWDPAKFRIHEVRLVPRQIWVPDMMISNSLSNFEIYNSGSNLPVIVGFDGFRYWSIPVIINTKCTADVTFFPFDMQFCKIKLNSWTYHEKILKLQISDFATGMEGHVGNIEWTIVRVKGYLLYEPPITNHPLYTNESINYTYIEYRMALARKPDFYVNTLVVPSLLLSWLGAVIFLLPSECGEKLSFSITLFLALYINQVIVSEFLPPSADTYPLIAKFYMLISIILGGSIFLTAVILMFHFRLNHNTPDERSIGYKVFRILEKIGSLSCLGLGRRSQKKAQLPDDKSKVQFSKLEPCKVVSNISATCPDGTRSYLEMANQTLSELPNPQFDIRDATTKFGSSSSNGNVASLIDGASSNSKRPKVITCSGKVEEYLKDILAKLDIVAKDDTAEVSLKRWRTLASGLDRIFFLAYLLIMGVTTMYFFLLVISIEKVKQHMDFDDILDDMNK